MCTNILFVLTLCIIVVACTTEVRTVRFKDEDEVTPARDYPREWYSTMEAMKSAPARRWPLAPEESENDFTWLRYSGNRMKAADNQLPPKEHAASLRHLTEEEEKCDSSEKDVHVVHSKRIPAKARWGSLHL